MTLINNGEITTQKKINEVQKAEVKNTFARAEVWENTIQITEEYGDIECKLRDLCQWLAENGNPATDVSIDCIGDYEGGYRLKEGFHSVEWCDARELGLNDTGTEELVEELASRGYECVKKDEEISVGTVVKVLVDAPDGIYGETHKGSIGVVIQVNGTDYAVATKKPGEAFWYGRERLATAGVEDIKRFVRKFFGL